MCATCLNWHRPGFCFSEVRTPCIGAVSTKICERPRHDGWHQCAALEPGCRAGAGTNRVPTAAPVSVQADV